MYAHGFRILWVLDDLDDGFAIMKSYVLQHNLEDIFYGHGYLPIVDCVRNILLGFERLIESNYHIIIVPAYSSHQNMCGHSIMRTDRRNSLI